jgi:hypothetical protein
MDWRCAVGGGGCMCLWWGTWKRGIKVRFGNEPHDTTAGRETGAVGWIGVCNIYFIAPWGGIGRKLSCHVLLISVCLEY